jgi:hypothetical protein
MIDNIKITPIIEEIEKENKKYVGKENRKKK